MKIHHLDVDLVVEAFLADGGAVRACLGAYALDTAVDLIGPDELYDDAPAWLVALHGEHGADIHDHLRLIDTLIDDGGVLDRSAPDWLVTLYDEWTLYVAPDLAVDLAETLAAERRAESRYG